MKGLEMRLLATWLAVVCVAGGAESVLMDGVAAYVNEDTVTVGDVLTVLEPVRRQLVRRYAGEELATRLRKAYADALNAAIEKRLVLASYNSQKVRLPDWVIDERINDIISEMFEGDRDALMQALAKDHLSYDEWRGTIQDQMAASSMRSAHVEQLVSVAPGDVRRFYDQNTERFQSDARVHLRMIVLKKDKNVERSPEADGVMKRLAAGEEFAALARAVSEGDKAEDGGDWGWVEPSLLRAELAEAVSRIKPGQVGELIETKDEIYILKVEGKQESAVFPFTDVQEEIERELRREAIEVAYSAWMGRLKEEAYIKIFEVDLFR